MSTRQKSSGVRQKSAADESPAPTKPGRGRPSKYKPEYCRLVIPHMTKGLSLEAFAGLIGVSRDTPAGWREQHPAFAEACSIGDGRRLLFWEQLNIDTCTGKHKGVAPATLIFTLKNVANWRDRQDVSHKHEGTVRIEVAYSHDWRAPTE